jgi:hypothetical protein
MGAFFDWAEKRELTLPPLSERTTRSGIAYWAYPDLYIRSHYPDGWFMPIAADARMKMGKHKPPHTQKHK